MTTLEEVFLHLETQRNEDEDKQIENLGKKMVRNRALSRSLSLQGRCNSFQSINGTIRSLPDCKTNCCGDDESINLEINELTKTNWMELNDVVLKPGNLKTIFALLKLRLIILIRDLQRLYLMIILPFGFVAIGLYLNSIQIILPVMHSLILDNETYPNDVTKLLINQKTKNYETKLFLTELNQTVETVENYNGSFAVLLNFLPNMGAFNLNYFNLNNLTITVLYNDTTQHSLPILLNLLSNLLLKLNSDDDYEKIEIRSHPFQQTVQPQQFNIGTFSSAIFVGMIFVLIPVSLSIDMVYDREMKAKNLLRVNGLSSILYFLAYFTVLTGIMLIICSALLGLIFLFDIPSFRQTPALLTLGLLIFLYSPAAILCSTCFSYLFNRTDSAQSILPNILTFIGLIPFGLVIFLDMLGLDVKTAKNLHYLFSLINPMYIPYAAVYFVDRVYVTCRLNSACGQLTINNYLTEEILLMAIGSILHIPLWLFLLKIIEILKTGGQLNDLFCKFKPIQIDEELNEQNDCEYEDFDVKQERNKINLLIDETVQPVIIVNNLRKEFKQKRNCCSGLCNEKQQKKIAVKSLALSVDAGEVLGLLGHNGAGKTTTLKIITGETKPTRGQIKIGGWNILTNKKEAFRTLGYCPQHDALWKTITVREHLEVYASIRGVSRTDLPRVINTYLHGLQIHEHANKQTQNCSGGTRRKLSYAMAMVGSPKVVLLDEPSTGMDPKSKRFLWDTILSSFQGKRGAILTTHSMEEADALCSRVGIMVKGELRCLGSTQHLKNLYGAGYTLEVKLKNSELNQTEFDEKVERTQALRLFVSNLFPDAILEESFADRLVYSVPQHAVSSLADCFSKLEKAKQELNIEEYSFSQTTLEQVFLKFAHYDEEILEQIEH